MIPFTIEELINKRVVEDNRIEYKAGYNAEEILHEIVAFANDIDNMGGGYVIIGVEDDGKGRPKLPIKGLGEDNIEKIEKDLIEKCHLISPHYIPKSEIQEYEGAKVLIIQAYPGYGRPYSCPVKLGKNEHARSCYIRKFSSCLKAVNDDLRELYEVSSTIPFDDQMNPFAEASDLSISLVKEYLKEIGSSALSIKDKKDEDLFSDLGLLAGPKEDRHPKNSALLFFSDHSERFFKSAYIEVVNLPSETGLDITEKKFTGPIQHQLVNALEYLKNNAIEEKIIKDKNEAKAKHCYSYPFIALRELLSNAVYHRSYKINEPITVTIRPSSIEIKSFPELDHPITNADIENLRIHSSLPCRNRNIGAMLKDLHLTEGRNTGIPLAKEALKENGSEPPQFMVDDKRSSLIVKIKIHPSFISPEQANKERANKEAISTRVLLLLSSKDYSMREIALELGYKGISKTLSGVISSLVENGKIVKKGAGRSSKYGLK